MIIFFKQETRQNLSPQEEGRGRFTVSDVCCCFFLSHKVRQFQPPKIEMHPRLWSGPTQPPTSS